MKFRNSVLSQGRGAPGPSEASRRNGNFWRRKAIWLKPRTPG